MKVKTLLLFAITAVCLVQTGCRRSPGDVWEDTKTAGRQVGKGIRCLSGNHNVSRQINCADDFKGPTSDHEFTPLQDNDIANRLAMQGGSDQPMNTPGEAGSGLPGIDGFASPRTAEQLRVFQNIHFDTNEYAIRGQENLEILGNVAAYMNKNPNLYVFVEGHCDHKGPAAYNLALGTKRANAVRNQLIKDGVDPEHIHTISYGKERPCVEGTDPASMAQNRRDEFKLYFQ